MERTWADHDEESIIALVDNLDGFLATATDCVEGEGRGRNFSFEKLWWNERVVAQDGGVLYASGRYLGTVHVVEEATS